jgi:signal transduction histidine kinase/ligand-binding sensor domain-containing protein
MRFDGITFSRFPIENFAGPIDTHICTVLYSRTDVLWFVTYGGKVFGLKPDFSVMALPQTGLPAATLLSLAEDKDGSLWLGYANLILRVKNGKIAQFTEPQGVPSGRFHSLASDGAGNIWLAKGNRIGFFRNEQFQPAVNGREAQCLAATRTNAVWFVADRHLFTCDTGGALRDYGAFRDLSTANRRGLLQDHAGAVWIGTYDNGLIRYGSSGFEKVETSYPTIVGLAEDREGNIWASTEGGGLNRVSLSGVRLDALNAKPVLEQVQSICEDTRGVLWGATYNGTLISRVQGQWNPVFTNASFAGTVRCVAADQGGWIWAGTQDGTLLHLANTNYTTYRSNAIQGGIAFLPTSKGDLWIVGDDVLQCLRDGQLQEIALPRKVGRFSAIAEDAAGDIWVGAKGVVLRFRGKECVDETPRLPISGRAVCCLYATPDGSMWISCGGLGLLRFKDGQVGRLSTEQGLYNDYISQIIADDQGWLWFGSDHGIFKIPQRQLGQAVEDHNVRLRPIVYGRNEGLSSLEALFSTSAPLVFPRAICTRDGGVWLLTHTGIVAADPKVPSQEYPPPVLLTRVAMDKQTIAAYGSVASNHKAANLKASGIPLRLPPSHHCLEFDFTAIHFTAPENLHFRYQVVGFDNDWIEAGAERHADYSRLAAGDYQFRVQACIGSGPWSEAQSTVAFTVAPFFWQTWWFRLGVLVLFTGTVIAMVRYISFRRLRLKLRAAEQQAAIERERGRIARDIHDDLGNRLTKIQLLTGLAQRDRAAPDKTITHVQQIASTVRQATDALDEIVWAINPRNDTLPHLINYLGQFAVELLRTGGIRCRVDLSEHPPVQPVSAEVRHNLFLAVKESLNNILRHAHATEVSLSVLVTDESIRVIIEDNGHGFNGEVKNNEADGLENMRQRMGEIGGQFQIKSAPGTGTWVSFNGPWLAKK